MYREVEALSMSFRGVTRRVGAVLLISLMLPLAAFAKPGYSQSFPSVADAVKQAIAAGAPSEPLQQLVARWEKQRYPTGPGLVVIKTIAQVASDGLPTEPVIQKAMEGLAKNVIAELIGKVVEHRAQTLRIARNLLDIKLVGTESQERSRAIQALSDALAQGASHDDLEKSIQQVAMVKGANQLQWIEAVADSVAGLLSSGIDSRLATEITIGKFGDAKSPDDLRQLAGYALALQHKGLPPSQIVEQLRHDFKSDSKVSPSTERTPRTQPSTSTSPRSLPKPAGRPTR